MGKGCTQRMLIYSGTGITAAVDTSPVAVPSNVDDFYIKTNVTEDSAGGASFALYGNESNSTTGGFVIDNLGGAKTATGIDYAYRIGLSAANQQVLAPYVFVGIASVTGSWTAVIELWYSETGG